MIMHERRIHLAVTTIDILVTILSNETCSVSWGWERISEVISGLRLQGYLIVRDNPLLFLELLIFAVVNILVFFSREGVPVARLLMLLSGVFAVSLLI